jgi:membrane-associated phospholipid phosphatase
MELLTNFGDAALLLPLSGILLLWLLFARSGKAAGWWLLALVLCNGFTAILKVYFFACPPLPGLDSPSGHTSFSVIVYGGMTAIVALEIRSAWMRGAAIAAGSAFVVAIAASRLILHRHTPIEVLSGFIIGGFALAIFVRRYRRLRSPGGRLMLLFAPALAILALVHGAQLNSEEMLHAISAWLGIRRLACS